MLDAASKFKVFSFLFFVLVMGPFSAHAFDLASVEWVALGVKDGIENYAAIKLGHKYKSVRGIMKVAMPAERVVSEIIDAEKSSKWMHRVKRVDVIDRNRADEPLFQFEWNVPWPFHNRKVILTQTVERDEDARSVTIRYTDYEGQVAGIQEKYRMRDFMCTWVVEKLPGGSTRVDLVIDPSRGGKVPAWFVNLFFKEAAHKSLKNMRQWLSKV